MRARVFPVLPGLLLIAACAGEPPKPEPAFYTDLARPGATFDPKTATDIINAYRANHNLAPLAWDDGLARIAETVARDLAARGDLSDGGGEGVLRALALGGYPVREVRRSVTGGYHSFADAFSGWRGAPGHDAVLRDPNGRKYAIAVLAQPGSRHRVYWVMFVSPR